MNPREIPNGWPALVRLRGRVKLALARRLWRYDIGPRTCVHPRALLDRTWPRGLHIGSDCIIAADVAVLTHDFTRGLLVDTVIGDRCSIGQRAIIMPGLTIGDDCTILPGAIVTRDMPAQSTAYGNPAVIEPKPAAGSARAA